MKNYSSMEVNYKPKYCDMCEKEIGDEKPYWFGCTKNIDGDLIDCSGIFCCKECLLEQLRTIDFSTIFMINMGGKTFKEIFLKEE